MACIRVRVRESVRVGVKVEVRVRVRVGVGVKVNVGVKIGVRVGFSVRSKKEKTEEILRQQWRTLLLHRGRDVSQNTACWT